MSEPIIPQKTLTQRKYCHTAKGKATRRKYRKEHAIQAQKRKKKRYSELKKAGLCVSCGQKRVIPKKRFCLQCWQKNKASKIKANLRVKDEVFAHYGGYKCKSCGITDPLVLAIDHIKNDGAEHRKKKGVGTLLYQWLKQNNFPKGFQVLCYNCNIRKYRLERLEKLRKQGILS